MSTPVRPTLQAPPRRAVLRAAGLAALTGALGSCGLDWGNLRLQTDAASSPVAGPDELLRRQAARAVETLLATTAAVQGRVSGQASLVDRLRRLTVAHQEWLTALGAPQRATSTSATASATADPTPTSLVWSLHEGASALLSDARDAGGPMVRLVAAVVGGLIVGGRDVAIEIGMTPPGAPRARGEDLPGVDDPQLSTWLQPPRAPVGVPGAGGEPQIPAASSPLGAIADGAAQSSLAACAQSEYAAEYGYPMVAVPLPSQARARALRRSAVHRTAAANLSAVAETLGFARSPSELAYPIDAPSSARAARATAWKLELDCAEAFSVLVSRLTAEHADTRALFVDAMIERVLAAREYAAVPTLPGLAEHR